MNAVYIEANKEIELFMKQRRRLTIIEQIDFDQILAKKLKSGSQQHA